MKKFLVVALLCALPNLAFADSATSKPTAQKATSQAAAAAAAAKAAAAEAKEIAEAARQEKEAAETEAKALKAIAKAAKNTATTKKAAKTTSKATSKATAEATSKAAAEAASKAAAKMEAQATAKIAAQATAKAVAEAAAKKAAAQAVAKEAAKTHRDVKYLQITIKSLKVWPVKPSGRCWDPCLGKRYKLPARGNKKYTDYLNHPSFKKLCTGTKAPDPLVEINIGKYEKFTTDKINNQCAPNFNISFTVPLNTSLPFKLAVYDNDGAAGIQVKRDMMGLINRDSLPAKLAAGGTLVFRDFGQIEELVLESKIITKEVKKGCEGVYHVRVVEFAVNDKKADGKKWDRGFGKSVKPDVMLSLKIGTHSFESKKQANSLKGIFSNISKTIPIQKGMPVILGLNDKDLFNRKEVIGQTAVSDVCSLINKSGVYTFKPFGQVSKVVVLFNKVK